MCDRAIHLDEQKVVHLEPILAQMAIAGEEILDRRGVPILPLSTPRRTLGDDVDDFNRHHHFAGLIDYLNE